MQQMTTSHRFPVKAGAATLAGALVLVLALAALLNVLKPASPPVLRPADDALVTGKPLSRVFADEAAYVPAVSEYTSAVLSEDYLPLSAAVSPAPVQRTVFASRLFADEAASVLTAGEYAALGEDYLPLVPFAPARPAPLPGSRFFRDELVGAALPAAWVELNPGEAGEPGAGPR